MKTPKGIKLVTVGALTKDLKRFMKKHADEDVVCYSSDGETYYVETCDTDEDGDLWIGVNDDEYDGGYYTVDMLLDALEGYDATTRVYMGGFGEYMTFEADLSTSSGQAQGRIFSYDDENEVVGCDGQSFEPKEESGHVREPQRRSGRSGWFTEAELRQKEEDVKREKAKAKRETIVLAILTLATIVGLGYHVYGLVAGTGAVWSHVLWGIALLICSVIGSLTLYYSEE